MNTGCGFKVTTTRLTAPLPRDFTISYDVVAARDYTWGARGLTFRVSKGIANSGNDSFLTLRLRPGSGGKDGEAVIEGTFRGAPDYLSGTKYAVVPGFSNNQQNNRIAVTIRKQGEMVEVLIGKVSIARYDKAVPGALLFDAVSFDLQGEPGPNDQMFVSNIRITKN